jgi:beta-glucosidase
MRDFPEGFLFGSSTAAHQVEGGNVGNDWWAWEHSGRSPVVEPSGDAIDQYHRYEEDFALLASLGQQAHRVSLEWWRSSPSRANGAGRGWSTTGACSAASRTRA